MYGLLTDFILLCTCNLYPVFASFKAIRSRDGDEWARWMMYFICFSLFKVATHLTDYIFFWLPFYEIAKLGFAIWLLPVFGGSKVFYQRLVHPNLLKYEIEIDLFIASISSRAISLGRILFSFALQKTTEKLEQAPQLMGMAMNLMAEQQLRQKEQQQQQQQQQRVIHDIPQHSTVTEDDRIGNNNEPLEFSDEDDSAKKKRSYSPPQLINVNQDPQILGSPTDDKFLSSDNDDLHGATTATLSNPQTKQKQPTRRLASKYQNTSEKRKNNNNDNDDDAKIRSNTYESSTIPRVKKLRDRKTNDV